jgi:alanyl-tRNA synthetase
MRIFNDIADDAKNGVIAGIDVFRLYDTYGFPADLTADIARERGLTLDMEGFNTAMEQQRENARAAGHFISNTGLPAELVARLVPTDFLGYDSLRTDTAKIVALLKDGQPVQTIEAGDDAVVLLDRTPLYAESGGQIGDRGILANASGARFIVADTQKFAGQFHGHVGTVDEGKLEVGDTVTAAVDDERRNAIVLNHSATHLLHAALRDVLGTHVQQRGSLVAFDRLRFDFSHFQAVTRDELIEIENKVNARIRANHDVEIHHMGMQDALDFGAMALFGEKYGEQVRVLKMGDYSIELCGGTHVRRTGDIGLFKIISEGGVSAGIRRIEAITGQEALNHVFTEERCLNDIVSLLNCTVADAVDRLQMQLDRVKKLEKEIEGFKTKAASTATADLASLAVKMGDVSVLATRLEGFDAKALREAVDRLKQQLGNAVILLAGTQDGRATLVAGVSGHIMGKINAGELLAHVASQIEGRGGGRPDLAHGGGKDGAALATALQGVSRCVEQHLS